MSELLFSSAPQGGVQIVELAGRLDNLAAAELDRRLSELAGMRTVLDLAKLEYIGSAGLRSVLAALKRAEAASGRLVLAAPAPPVAEVLGISGFVTLIPVYPDRAAALAALG